MKITPLVMQEPSQNTEWGGLHTVQHKNTQNIIICVVATLNVKLLTGRKEHFSEECPHPICVCGIRVPVLVMVWLPLDLAILFRQLLPPPANPGAQQEWEQLPAFLLSICSWGEPDWMGFLHAEIHMSCLKWWHKMCPAGTCSPLDLIPALNCPWPYNQQAVFPMWTSWQK